MPFDIQLGISKKLEYLPFRFAVHAHNLLKWDIRYDNPNLQQDNPFLGQDTVQKNYFADKLFRHLIFSGEFYFGKNVRIRLGYNHLNRQELKVENAGAFAGVSFGAGIRIKRFKIDYGRGNFHVASGINHLSITMDMNGMKLPKFGKKKKKPISDK